MSGLEERCVLYVDKSEESEEIRRALENVGLECQVVFAADPEGVVPSLEHPLGAFRGSDNIRRYVLAGWAKAANGEDED